MLKMCPYHLQCYQKSRLYGDHQLQQHQLLQHTLSVRTPLSLPVRSALPRLQSDPAKNEPQANTAFQEVCSAKRKHEYKCPAESSSKGFVCKFYSKKAAHNSKKHLNGEKWARLQLDKGEDQPFELTSLDTDTDTTDYVQSVSEVYFRKWEQHGDAREVIGTTQKTDQPFLAVVSARRPEALQRREKKNTHNRTCLILNQTHTRQLLILLSSTNIKTAVCLSHRDKLHLFCNSRSTRSNV